MANKIQIRRGDESTIPVLSEGELGWTIDTKKLFIGNTTGGNSLIGSGNHIGLGGIEQHPLGDGTTAGFSTNDFSAAEKTKLTNIASDANKTTFASQSQVNAGTATDLALYPAHKATTANRGTIQIATQTEVNNGSVADKAVAPNVLASTYLKIADSPDFPDLTFTEGPLPPATRLTYYTSAAEAENGKIILAPDRGNLGIYDPTANTITDGPDILYKNSQYAFSDTIALPNGKILLVPDQNDFTVIYDPIANTVESLPNMNVFFRKYSQGVLTPNGKVIYIPKSTNVAIGIYDIETNSFSYGASPNSDFSGGVLAGNGKIIMIPEYSTNPFGIYDYITNTFTNGPTVTYTNLSKGILLNTGKIMFISSKIIRLYDPATDIISNGPTISEDMSIYAFPMTYVSNGKIVVADTRALGSGKMGIYDPVADTFTESNLTFAAGTVSYISGINLSDGRIFLPPSTRDISIGIINDGLNLTLMSDKEMHEGISRMPHAIDSRTLSRVYMRKVQGGNNNNIILFGENGEIKDSEIPLTSNPSMLINLGSTTAATVLSSNPRPGVTGVLPVANGGTGNTSGAIEKSQQLATPRDLTTDLASTAAGSFDGTGDTDIGVKGVLGVGNGGTSLTSSPSLLTDLASSTATNIFTASPRPGVTGILSSENGGTGYNSLTAALNALPNI